LKAQQHPTWSAGEQPIFDQLRGLRGVPDDKRGAVTRQMAAAIQKLPKTPNKIRLAEGLAGLSTEGDFGAQTLEAVAAMLEDVLREQPVPDDHGQPAMPYVSLAQLARYEHIAVSFDAPAYKAAFAKLDADDKRRASADLSLQDLSGKTWTLSALRGNVVLLNFWATWCPPCRKEMPDLESLYNEFHKQGLVVLAISDEEATKVNPFISERSVHYPVLLDPGRKVNDLFAVEGIPKSFVFDRDGKLVATAIDMRTKGQFLAMLARAGLR
jgi:peroxiredoxin